MEGRKRIQGAEGNRGYRVFHRGKRGISGEREGLDVQERSECSVIALFAVTPVYIYIYIASNDLNLMLPVVSRVPEKYRMHTRRHDWFC